MKEIKGQIFFSPSIPKTFTEAFEKEPEYKTDPIIAVPKKNSLTQAIAWRIETTRSNISQYARNFKAHALAHMPFIQIANSARYIGDKVEFFKKNVPVQQNQAKTVGDIVEEQYRVWAWQDRGEHIVISNQLPDPTQEQAVGKIIPITSLETPEQLTNQTLRVVEGISASVKPNEISDTYHDEELFSNPYLMKKAA